MILVNDNNVKFEISNKTPAWVLDKLDPKIALEVSLSVDLCVLWCALFSKYGEAKTATMIQRSLENARETMKAADSQGEDIGSWGQSE